MRRRANNEGTFEHDPKRKNPWRLVVKSGAQKKRGPWSSTKTAAKSGWKLKHGRPAAVVASSDRTLNDVLGEKFEKKWARELARNTLSSYLNAWEQFIEKDPLGSKLIREIDERAIVEWRESAYAAGVQPPSIHKAMTMLSKLLKEEKNPAMAYVKFPKWTVRKKQVVTPAQTGDVLEYFKTPESRLAVILMMEGMSRGEIAALHDDQIEGEWITIDRQATEVDGVVEVTRILKRPRRYRKIWLPEEARAEMAKIREKSPAGLFFPGMPEKGRKRQKNRKEWEMPMHPTALTRMVARALKGTPFQGVRPHALRSAFAQHMLEASVDVRTAAEQLGNDPATMARFYLQSRPELKQSASEKVAALRKAPRKRTPESKKAG